MQATAKWQEGFHFIVDDNQGHQIGVDLPLGKKGTNLGPTAFHLSLMSLAGCVATIYLMIANNSNVQVDSLEASCLAKTNEKGNEIVKVVVENKISSTADRQMLEKIMTKTIKACPVGILFSKAGIILEEKLIIN